MCCFRFKIKDRPSQLKLITRLAGEVSINDSQPTVSTNQSPVFSNTGNHVLEVREFGYPAPIVLTPSEASESGLGSQNGEFQFPSPPKPNPRSRDASRDRNSTNQNQPDLESLLSSPARSSSRNDFIKNQLTKYRLYGWNWNGTLLFICVGGDENVWLTPTHCFDNNSKHFYKIEIKSKWF